MKHLLLSLVASIICSPCVSAVVISNTNITLGSGADAPSYGSPSGAAYKLTVYQDLQGDPTSIFFNVSSTGTLTFVTTFLDEGSDWYLTQNLSEFSDANIDTDLFRAFVKATPTGFETNTLTVGSTFYLGVNTGKWDANFQPDLPRNLYGWIALRRIGTTLSVLGNAMSYDGTGIIVGTTQAIPEPSALTLLLGFFVTTSFRRRR